MVVDVPVDGNGKWPRWFPFESQTIVIWGISEIFGQMKTGAGQDMANAAPLTAECAETPEKLWLASKLFPVDRPRHSPYVPRNFEGGVSSPRERVAQPVEQLTFNQ